MGYRKQSSPQTIDLWSDKRLPHKVAASSLKGIAHGFSTVSKSLKIMHCQHDDDWEKFNQTVINHDLDKS